MYKRKKTLAKRETPHPKTKGGNNLSGNENDTGQSPRGQDGQRIENQKYNYKWHNEFRLSFVVLIRRFLHPFRRISTQCFIRMLPRCRRCFVVMVMMAWHICSLYHRSRDPMQTAINQRKTHTEFVLTMDLIMPPMKINNCIWIRGTRKLSQVRQREFFHVPSYQNVLSCQCIYYLLLRNAPI